MSIWTLIYRISASVVIVVVLSSAVRFIYPKFRQFRDLSSLQLQVEEEIRRDEELLRHLRLKQQRLLNDPRFVEKIAREELGLAKPGETVFKFTDESSPATGKTGTTNKARQSPR